jgi:hypothetical protein
VGLGLHVSTLAREFQTFWEAEERKSGGWREIESKWGRGGGGGKRVSEENCISGFIKEKNRIEK